MPIRVVLAEDSLLVREGITRLLEQDDDIEVAGAAGDLDGLLALIDAEDPDVVVTDIRMPPTKTDEGIRAAEQLRQDRPDTGVVVLSQYDDPAYALSLFERGSASRAYLLKESVSEGAQLSEAIRAVADGRSVIDPRVVDSLVAARGKAVSSPLRLLTAREQEILAAMAEGKNNMGIAASLAISERAVEKHINSIFSKLGLSEETDTHKRVRAVLAFLSDR